MTMLPPTRSEFLRSRFYLCAQSLDRRNEQRLKNIRDLLERADDGQKARTALKRCSKSMAVKLPDLSDPHGKHRLSPTDQAILDADKDDVKWVLNETRQEYDLSFDGRLAMRMPKTVYKQLYDFQKDGIKWIAGVGPIGGILADDMGMGKTVVSCAALGALILANKGLRMILVVAPVSVLNGWKEEAKKYVTKFNNRISIVKVHGQNAIDRKKTIRNAWKKSSEETPCIIITSWGLFGAARSSDTFKPPSGRIWDYVILDEAHEIRNHKANRYKCCAQICHKRGTRRLLLTGTPFQNNTDELWSIVHMATAGRVLDKRIKAFNKEYGKPIREARCKNATSCVKKTGTKANEQLQETLKPYILRRNKLDFLKDELPPRTDTCVFVKASTQQIAMYKKIVDSMSSATQAMMSTDKKKANSARKSAFPVMTELQKLCSHPLLLCKGGPEGCIMSALEQTSMDQIIHGSRKLQLLLHMLKGFKSEGHKTLVFSHRTQTLDIIGYVLRNKNVLFARIDGGTSEKKRTDIVDVFQNQKEQDLIDVLLISTKAGGTGITLTRASRVIIYDPSWNPSDDSQAVDRAYRIGQTQSVRNYRLFVAGSIEEKMYERQTDKRGLEMTIFDDSDHVPTRFFDKKELCKVFAQVPDGKTCNLLSRFEEEKVAQVLELHHHDLVRAHGSVIGICNHNRVYKNKRKGVFGDSKASVTKRPKTSDMTVDKETDSDVENQEAPFNGEVSVSHSVIPSPGVV